MLTIQPKIVLAILSLSLFSSCGFIKIDTSVAAEQFTDFSGTEEDCGCKEQPPIQSPCLIKYAPVCGCNGFTYKNDCVARRSGLKFYTIGSCTRRPATLLYKIYGPVCGSNGVTYRSACVALDFGIIHYTRGKCLELPLPRKLN